MTDRCKGLKLEDLPFGSSVDFTPTEVAPNSDGMDARAYFVQSATSADSTAYVSRAAAGADLTLTDANAGTKAAQDLVSRVSGAVGAHNALLDIIHVLEDGGPGDGWASGATCKVTYTGLLPVNKTWTVSAAAGAAKILSIAYGYVAGSPLVATKTYTLYTAAGAVARVLTDTYTRAGPTVTQVARTWS